MRRPGRAARGPGRCLLVLAMLVALGATAAPALAAEATTRERLAMQFCRAAAMVLARVPLTVDNLYTATLLAREVRTLVPEDVEMWRFVRDVAVIAENEELYEEATRAVVRLDPHDDVARLARLNLAMDRYQSVEERVDASRRLTAPESRGKIGDAVASRLMMDLALLERRRGDTRAFGAALSEAVTIDPANRSAAAIAAGFFQTNVEDVHGEAELLANLVVADPTGLSSQLTLAQLLLERGAYHGAERMYAMGTANQAEIGQPTADGLLADKAIAQWANGHPDAALLTIRIRQRAVDDWLRNQVASEEPLLDPVERAKVHGSLRPTLATVRAAIMRQRGDERANMAAARALDAYDAAIAEAESAEAPDLAAIARLHLEKAWVAVWLGNDLRHPLGDHAGKADASAEPPVGLERVKGLIAAADALEPLEAEARTKFEGWIALRQGDADTALAKLREVTEVDVPTLLGIGHASLLNGEQGTAARAFLQAARAQPGTALGIWAANEVVDLVGRRVPISDEARRLEALIATIPLAFDRFPSSPTAALEVRVVQASSQLGPFEPVIVNVEIRNNSAVPLAIDRDGPIRPQVVLTFIASFGARTEPVEPVIIDIDRRLRLEPQERLVVPVDLRRYRIGDMLYASVNEGVFVRVRATLNFRRTPRGALEPALLGSEAWTDTIRIDGGGLTLSWATNAVTRLADPTQPVDPVMLALAARLVMVELAEDAPAQMFRFMRDARAAVISAFFRLDEAGQAWLLGTVEPGMLLDPLRQVAVENDLRHVRLSYLLYHVQAADDPVVAASVDSESELVRFIARRWVTRLEAESR